MSKTDTVTPTCNGIIKGRPGKGRVLSLGQRKRCYDGHAMTPDNTFRYTAKRVKGKPKPVEREWCKRCRAASRKRSAVKRLAEAKKAAASQRKASDAKLSEALPTAASSKAAKARKAKTAKARKAAASSKAKPKTIRAPRKMTEGQELTAAAIRKAVA